MPLNVMKCIACYYSMRIEFLTTSSYPVQEHRPARGSGKDVAGLSCYNKRLLLLILDEMAPDGLLVPLGELRDALGHDDAVPELDLLTGKIRIAVIIGNSRVEVSQF